MTTILHNSDASLVFKFIEKFSNPENTEWAKVGVLLWHGHWNIEHYSAFWCKTLKRVVMFLKDRGIYRLEFGLKNYIDDELLNKLSVRNIYKDENGETRIYAIAIENKK